MSDIDESQLQATIDELRASAGRFFDAAQNVEGRAQYLSAISMNLTYSASDWAGAGSQAFQNAWAQYDFDSHKAVNALISTGNTLNKLAQKLDEALQQKRQAEAEQGLMTIATVGLVILDVAQLGLDPVTDGATVAVGAGAVAADAVDLGALVADADIVAESELAEIETTEIGTLDTLDEGGLDAFSDDPIDLTANGEIPGISSENGGVFDESGLGEDVPDELADPDEPNGGDGKGGGDNGGDDSGDNSGSGGNSGPGGNPYPDPSNLENSIARSYAEKMENAIEDHLTPEDLEGAWRDLHGDPIPDPRNLGEFYDHLGEVNDALRSCRNAIQEFTELLKDPSLSSGDRSIIESLLSRASKTMDYVEKILNRDQWFPGTHIP